MEPPRRADDPVLVLLPGMDGTGDLFSPLLDAFDGRFETVVVRYAGDRTVEYADLLPIARAAIPHGRRFVIVAESFSGPVGICLASEATPDLQGLVLCASFARNPRPAFTQLARWILTIPMHAALISMGAMAMLGARVDPSLRARIERTVARISPATLRARLRSVLQVDVSRELATVSAPLLYLQATRDRAVPPSAADVLRKIKPDTTIVRIDGPHFLLQVRPEAAATEIERFVVSVSSPG